MFSIDLLYLITVYNMGLNVRKPVRVLQTTKAQISLRIDAVWSALCYSLSSMFEKCDIKTFYR